jgi:hypothetical protein
MEHGEKMNSFEKARTILMDKSGKPTDHYTAYLQYSNEWQTKMNSYNEAYSKALADPMKLQRWPIEGKQYRAEIDSAWNKWIALGFKNEIEGAVNILKSQNNEPMVSDLIKNINPKNKF